MLIRNATFPDGDVRDVRIDGSQIAEVGQSLSEDQPAGAIDATGLRILPGAIDVHVHFREPGFSHKETWESGTASAAAGGVTTVVDQPNTDPPTISGEAFDSKATLAAAAHVDFGINGGVTPEWDPESLFERPLFALGEIFLADSTGDLGIDQDLFEEAVERANEAELPVTVHAEDASLFDASVQDRTDATAWSEYRPPEAELTAVETAIAVADRTETTLHIAHTSTPEAVDAATDAGLTCEVSPHHLFLSTTDLDDLGTLGRMNPPLRDPDRQQGLWDRLIDGTIDMVATDHAPHTLAEKDASIWDAPSGVPGVETMLPLLAAAAERGELSYERIAEVTARRPAAVFNLDQKGRIEAGADADLTLLDPEPQPIDSASLHTACEWTPFESWDGVFPIFTMVRGRIVYEDGRLGDPIGRNVRTA